MLAEYKLADRYQRLAHDYYVVFIENANSESASIQIDVGIDETAIWRARTETGKAGGHLGRDTDRRVVNVEIAGNCWKLIENCLSAASRL